MPFEVRLTAKAEADIGAVLAWFRDEQAADAGGRWLAGLRTKLLSLESRPEHCGLAAEAIHVGEEVRELLVGRTRFKHRLLFVIREKSVDILRVWHSSRDAVTRDDLK